MVVDKARNALVIAAADDAALRAGVCVGMTLATARAIHPALLAVEADAAADAALLEVLADWAERYTPFVGLDGPDGLALDVTGSAHLFGGEAAMLDDLVARLRRGGVEARGAIAGTLSAARALARFGGAGGRVVPAGGEALAVGRLPVEAIAPPETVTALARLGLKRIEDLAERPRGPLAARFGAGLLDRLDRVRGLAGEPVSPRRPLPACTAERRFAEPIGHEEDVRRSILAMAGELAGVLERRGEGARRLELTFFRADGAVRRIAVATGRPVRDPAALARLYREKLDALADPVDPGFGFDVMRLAALATERQDAAQTGLDRQAEEGEALAELADRLAARFGPRRVQRLVAQDTHIPERAAFAAPAQRVGGAGAAKTAEAAAEWAFHRVPEEPPPRPLRLLDPPERIEALAEIPDGPPIRFRWRRALHLVRKAEGPERIAPEWWRASPDALTRDYFRVEDEAGRRFWLFREGLWGYETASPSWFLHGLFA
ncbi:Y-family DNA polymerase [Alsobacter sp. SYSU BS001988]